MLQEPYSGVMAANVQELVDTPAPKSMDWSQSTWRGYQQRNMKPNPGHKRWVSMPGSLKHRASMSDLNKRSYQRKNIQRHNSISGTCDMIVKQQLRPKLTDPVPMVSNGFKMPLRDDLKVHTPTSEEVKPSTVSCDYTTINESRPSGKNGAKYGFQNATDEELAESLYQQIGYCPSSYATETINTDDDDDISSGVSDVPSVSSISGNNYTPYRRKRPVSVFLGDDYNDKRGAGVAPPHTTPVLNNNNAQEELKACLSAVYSESLTKEEYCHADAKEISTEVGDCSGYESSKDQVVVEEPALTVGSTATSTYEPKTETGDSGKPAEAEAGTDSVTLYDDAADLATLADNNCGNENSKRISWFHHFFRSDNLEDCTEQKDSFGAETQEKEICRDSCKSGQGSCCSAESTMKGLFRSQRERYKRFKTKLLSFMRLIRIEEDTMGTTDRI